MSTTSSASTKKKKVLKRSKSRKSVRDINGKSSKDKVKSTTNIAEKKPSGRRNNSIFVNGKEQLKRDKSTSSLSITTSPDDGDLHPSKHGIAPSNGDLSKMVKEDMKSKQTANGDTEESINDENEVQTRERSGTAEIIRVVNTKRPTTVRSKSKDKFFETPTRPASSSTLSSTSFSTMDKDETIKFLRQKNRELKFELRQANEKIRYAGQTTDTTLTQEITNLRLKVHQMTRKRVKLEKKIESLTNDNMALKSRNAGVLLARSKSKSRLLHNTIKKRGKSPRSTPSTSTNASPTFEGKRFSKPTLSSLRARSKAKKKKQIEKLSPSVAQVNLANEVEQLKETVTKLERQRQELSSENTSLKDEVVSLTGQVGDTPGQHAALEQQVNELQSSVLGYQEKIAAMKASQNANSVKSSASMAERVKALEQYVETLKRENEKLKSTQAPDNDSAQSRVAELEASNMELDKKYDYMRKKCEQLQAQLRNRSQKLKMVKLEEQVSSLNFQIMYGDTEKDREIEDLQRQVDRLEEETASIAKLKKRTEKMEKKRVEQWLFADDTNEVL